MKRTTIVAVALAFVVGLAGSATAASLITGKDIKNGSITGADIKNGSVYLGDLTDGAQVHIAKAGASGKDGAQGPAGTSGATGAPGAAGEKGDKGEKGLSGYEVRTYDYIRAGTREGKDGAAAGYPGAGGGSIATVACSSQDKVATGGGYFIRNGNDDDAPGLSDDGAFRSEAAAGDHGVVASFPGRMNWDDNTVRPNRLDGWIVQFNGNAPLDVTLYVICVNAP